MFVCLENENETNKNVSPYRSIGFGNGIEGEREAAKKESKNTQQKKGKHWINEYNGKRIIYISFPNIPSLLPTFSLTHSIFRSPVWLHRRTEFDVNKHMYLFIIFEL